VERRSSTSRLSLMLTWHLWIGRGRVARVHYAQGREMQDWVAAPCSRIFHRVAESSLQPKESISR